MLPGVQFMLDGLNIGTQATTSPYSIVWDTTSVADGNHTFLAVAQDTTGNYSTSSPLTITVRNHTVTPTTTPTSTGVGIPSSSGSYGIPFTPVVSSTSPTCPPGALYNSQTGSHCPGTYTYVKQPSTPHIPATPYTYPPTPTSSYTFTHNLTLGSTNPDVKQLQLFLTTQGFLNKKYDTGYFGILTRTALSKFQAKYGISPSVGYFGAVTRKAISTQ